MQLLNDAILLVEYHMQYHVFQEQTGQDTFGHTRIYDNRTGSYAESTTNPNGTNVGGRQMTTGWWNIDQGSLVAKRKITLTGIAAATAVTFKVYAYKHSSNDTDGYVQYNGEGSFDPPYTADFTSTMTVMEMQDKQWATKMGNNTVLTQSGTAKPTFGSGVLLVQ